MKKSSKVFLTVITILVAGTFLFPLFKVQQVKQQNLILHFSASLGNEPLSLNRSLHPNPGGDGQYRVRDFQMYLSNFSVAGDETVYREPDSYHLIRFDTDSGLSRVRLLNLPIENPDALSFAIGVDESANADIAPRGDLDPNSRMAWNWEVGYKFVLFEGNLVQDNLSYPLVYHIGFDENYTPLSFELDPEGKPNHLYFDVQLDRMFDAENRINMAALPNVKFDRNDADLIAANFPTMIRFCGNEPCLQD